MKCVFALAEFDPASVCLSHRDALRAARTQTGFPLIDYRLAVHTSYTDRQREADWVRVRFDGYDRAHDRTKYVEIPLNRSMLEFAAAADTFQIAPGIGQPWASEDVLHAIGGTDDPPYAAYMGVVWKECFELARHRVAFFHGSRCAWANREAYAKHYKGELKCTLATSTLDYAVAIGAHYLPPTAPVLGSTAPLRSDDDPLIVAHTPTDPSNCGTETFMKLAQQLGIVVRYATGVTPEEALTAKLNAHACYDHMRGSFSINTLEGMAAGCVPLVGVSEACRAHMVSQGFVPLEPWVRDLESLHYWLKKLNDDPALTRELQLRAKNMAASQFGSARIADRLAEFYGGL